MSSPFSHLQAHFSRNQFQWVSGLGLHRRLARRVTRGALVEPTEQRAESAPRPRCLALALQKPQQPQNRRHPSHGWTARLAPVSHATGHVARGPPRRPAHACRRRPPRQHPGSSLGARRKAREQDAAAGKASLTERRSTQPLQKRGRPRLPASSVLGPHSEPHTTAARGAPHHRAPGHRRAGSGMPNCYLPAAAAQLPGIDDDWSKNLGSPHQLQNPLI